MTAKNKFLLTLCLIAFILAAIPLSFVFAPHQKKREETSLINQYYKLMATNPEAAKNTLNVILKQDPTNIVARRELGYWYLRQGDTKNALTEFALAHRNDPEDSVVALELAKLYMMTNQYDEARILLQQSVKSNNPNTQIAARAALTQLPTTLPAVTAALPQVQTAPNGTATLALPTTTTTAATPIQPLTAPAAIAKATALATKAPAATTATKPAHKTPAATTTVATKMSQRDTLMNQYYDLKKKDPKKAWDLLTNQVLRLYPNDVEALKEAGYVALGKSNNALAKPYFVRAYEITHDPTLAMQLGYIFDDLNDKKAAYNYFDLATHTNKLSDRLPAEIAKTNLRGVQTQFLPDPYYLDLEYTPFHFSRFKLLVYPLTLRLGRTLNTKYNLQAYIVYRRTTDDRSGNAGQISQIFEDNDAVTDFGISVTPFPKFPLAAFIEAGKAVDLVYRQRARWRNDFRTGLDYYSEWGHDSRYTFKPTFSAYFKGDLYGDLIYFSRYLDTIGTFRARPGFEVFRWGSASVDIYAKGFIIQDQTRYFYNNLIEYGPGIAFTPNDRYNVTLRYENLNGHYLPSGGPEVNPYSVNYHNNVYELDTYFRF